MRQIVASRSPSLSRSDEAWEHTPQLNGEIHRAWRQSALHYGAVSNWDSARLRMPRLRLFIWPWGFENWN